jgi:ubiquinone/menaquinone biosynthesis C-methylase UbiE
MQIPANGVRMPVELANSEFRRQPLSWRGMIGLMRRETSELLVQATEVDTSAADAYETSLVPGLIAPWAELIVSEAKITEGMSVLDVGCGTGIVARHAARRSGSVGRVVGMDIDHGMLGAAKSVSIKEGLSIDYQYGSACELPFDSGAFDAVLCLQGLQYFPDPMRALREFRRVLKSRSVLAIVTWSELESCKGWWALVSALERRGIDASAARKPFALSSADEIRSLYARAGFEDISVHSEQRVSNFRSANHFVAAMLQGAPSTRLALGQVPKGEWPDFISEVDDLLAPWQTASGLAFPTQCNVLKARR